MKADSANPSTNQLRPGLSEEQLADAIGSSGYPLQTVIADYLRARFRVQEEWGYTDSSSGVVRTLDLFAERSYTPDDPNTFRVRPALDLLIECKQSELPYVFFLTDSVRAWRFPVVAGLYSSSVTIETDDDRSTWILPIIDVLELRSHPFLDAPNTAATFSKCFRAGKEVQLSGTDPYNSLVLPLASALANFVARTRPEVAAAWQDERVVLAVGILDAPMVGVRLQNRTTGLELVPWVRVVRNTPDARDHITRPYGESVVIDIVHRDYFSNYLEQWVEPFMTELRSRSEKHHEEIASGRAFAARMGEGSLSGIEQRLTPVTYTVTPPIRVPPGWRGLVQAGQNLSKHALGQIRMRSRRWRGRLAVWLGSSE
jgi:hypothetical protein